MVKIMTEVNVSIVREVGWVTVPGIKQAKVDARAE